MEYSKYAKDAIRQAKNVAKKMKAPYVGTQHLLIALCRQKNSVAGQILAKYGVSEKRIIQATELLVDLVKTKEVKQINSKRLETALEYSSLEAKVLKSSNVGTEHLLLILIKDEETLAYRILNTLKVSTQEMCEDILLGEEKEEGAENNNSNENINNFLKDLTLMAREGKIDPVLGRGKEIDRLMEIISRRTKNNPCLVGEPGIGKTAIVEGLALQLANGKVPSNLKNKRIVTMDLAAMLAGTKYRGEFEERVKGLIREAESDPDMILFMDEVHTIIGAGGAEGSVDAANMLKPALSRGKLQLIGATTTVEYRKYIEKDLALERRFQPIEVQEPSVQECLEILVGLKKTYEDYHNVYIENGILSYIIELTQRYIPDRFLPDKAIDVLDEACAKINLNGEKEAKSLTRLKEDLIQYQLEVVEALTEGDYDGAVKKNTLRESTLNKLNTSIKTKDKRNKKKVVTTSEVAQVVSRWSKVPVTKLEESEVIKLQNLETSLKKLVIGQEEAISAVSRAIKRGRVGLKSPNRPIGSFLFLGPTGVGKTELTKVLAEVLFATQDSLIRVDMSEYMEKQSVSKLIGSPPGYVGYQEGGQLTDKVRTNPYSVLLFDEVEKAHPDVFNVLLQVLDDGHVTDSKGRKIDFKNTIVIMTSNIGARSIVEPKELGFVTQDSEKERHERMQKNIMSELKQLFKPEFLNRLDDIIVFHMLEKEHIYKIVDKLAIEFVKNVHRNLNIHLQLHKSVKDLIVKKGTDKKYGARPLRRALQQEVEDAMADALLTGKIQSGDKVLAKEIDGKVLFSRK